MTTMSTVLVRVLQTASQDPNIAPLSGIIKRKNI